MLARARGRRLRCAAHAGAARCIDGAGGRYPGHQLERKIDEVVQRRLCATARGVDMALLPAELRRAPDFCDPWTNATFGLLRDQTRKPPYRFERRLSLPAFDITNGTLAFFNADTSPTMPISRAVRASSSIPVFFEPVEWQGHVFVDGVLMRRIPIDAFPTDMTMMALRMSRPFKPTRASDLPELSLFDFVLRTMRAAVMLSQDLDLWQRTEQRIRTCEFSEDAIIAQVSPIDFDMNETLKSSLYQAGYRIMRKCLSPCSAHQALSCAKPSCYDNAELDSCAWMAAQLEDARAVDAGTASASGCAMRLCKLMESAGLRATLIMPVSGLIAFALVVSTAIHVLYGLTRNACHDRLVHHPTFGGVQSAECPECLRAWVPSNLDVSRVPALTAPRLARALRSRGIPVSGKAGDVGDDRAKLARAVFWENISLRRPWTLVTFSTAWWLAPLRCLPPVNTTLFAALLGAWFYYIVLAGGDASFLEGWAKAVAASVTGLADLAPAAT